MNQTDNWKIVVDPNKVEDGSIEVTFRSKGVRVFVSVFADYKTNTIYVDAPIEPAVRANLIRLVKRNAF